MPPEPATRDELSHLERRLNRQLLVLAVVATVAGFAYGGAAWALAAGLGPLTAIGYFILLAHQTRRVCAAGRTPSPLGLTLAIAGRQALCVAVPAACFVALGNAWVAALVTLVVARHWILIVARPSAIPASGPVAAVAS